MNSNILMNEDITENIIVFRVSKSYKKNMTETELYDITRGCWKVDIKKAQQADYAFCVYEDTIKEVYKIEKWLPAEVMRRTTIPYAETDKGKYGFDGEIAEKEVRNKYRGKSVENLCKQGQYNFKYLFPCQNHVPNKNEPINNKEELCNNAVIEEAQKIEEEINSLNVEGESKKAIINVRVNQGIFRNLLLKRYNRCCLCKMENSELLIASHIKPWAESEPEEKLDVNNGFLMCPNHDKLFDKGYITFDDDGRIIISENLKEKDRNFLNVDNNMHIEKLTNGNKKYLEFHRKNVFNR